MDFSHYISRSAQIEKNNRIWGYIITTILLVPFLFLALIWQVHRTHFDNIGEGGETMESFMDMGDASDMGRPDFGDGSEGNRDVNNFDPSVENPTPPAPNAAQSTPTATPISTPQPAATAAEKGESKALTSNDDSPVSVPDKGKDIKKDDKKPTVPQPPQKPVTPTKPADTKPTTTPATTNNTTKPATTTTTTGSGGSNSGQTGTVGNVGSPDIKHLDPDGMYDFGAGGGGNGGGLKGRKPLSLSKPKYDVQQEGKVTFEFVVDPSGEVVYAKAVPPISKPALAKAGIDAIKNNWKFSKINSDENQTIRVTMTFKLKG